MLLANLGTVEKFARKHAAARASLASWIEIAQSATWKNLQDVRKTFPSADGVSLSGKRTATVFNIGGNNYRLVTVIAYSLQQIAIVEVLTHAEYDKQTWKDRV